MPPYLAGRREEQKEYKKLLNQNIILQNLILTGLRGVGKTCLLETFKPTAIQERWLWVGADLSESASVTERTMASRVLTDLSALTSSITIRHESSADIGFHSSTDQRPVTMNYEMLTQFYDRTPGLASDKLKAVLEFTWQCIKDQTRSGIIFAFDEAQNLADHAESNQYPLSTLLDVFQSIQKKEIPFMLALTGLPTLFPKLVEARTYSERMFRIVFLDKLQGKDILDAIQIPIQEANCPVRFNELSVKTIAELSGGYPYFIQFICREVYDVFIQQLDSGKDAKVPISEIERKLDSDFFAGRWARATDRQRDLLHVAAELENSAEEFTVAELVEKSNSMLKKPFGSSQVNQMLSHLCDLGLVYKNRRGRYSFAVPLLDRFISRQVRGALGG
jgi:hypothetical protein